MRKTQLFVGVYVVAVSMLFGVAIARAATTTVTMDKLPDSITRGDFVVGPGKQEMQISQGQSETMEVTIANRTGTDKVFTISEEDFEGSNDPGTTVVLLGSDRGPYSLKDYIHPATTSLMIANGYRARIPVTISVPSDAQPGGLYGSLLVGTQSAKVGTDSSNGAAPMAPIITRIGVLFFVRVPGDIKTSGHIVDFFLAGKRSILFTASDLKFDLLYKNEGNVHVDPSGTITITNMTGTPVATVPVDAWFAMPQSLRFREVEWKPAFLFGRYVAHASIYRGFGNASNTDEVDLVFWVIPWKIIVLVLAGLFIVISGLKFIFKRFKIVSKSK